MRLVVLAALAAVTGCASGERIDPVLAASAAPPRAVAASAGASERIGPIVDHHQHLLSPEAAAYLGQLDNPPSKEAVVVPAAVTELLRKRAAAWNDADALADLYTDDAVLLEDRPISGRDAVAGHVSGVFARPYEILPLSFAATGASAQLAALYTRSGDAERPDLGYTLMTLERDRRGTWRIAAEAMKFPATVPFEAVEADALIKQLDEADIRRAVVMSVAYFFETGLRPPHPQGGDRLRAENDWTAAQVAKYPERLVAFCGVNPLSDIALDEIRRCKDRLGMKGIKLHFGNSAVDLEKPDHLAKMKTFFATANAIRMPIAAHLWSGSKQYGRKDAELFLSELLPQAPDVVVQIMHMAGGGPGWTDEALEVFANAIGAGDPRTSKLYFDVATVADLQTHAQLQLLARRIRQIGPQRILYGSDASFGGRNTPDEEWGHFRGMVPLTDAEFAIIRDNVAPYLR